MLKLEKIYKERETKYTIRNDLKDQSLYMHLSRELKRFGKRNDINIDEQTIKGIILCIYSLLEFTMFNPSKERFCFVQCENGLAFSKIKGNQIDFLSFIPDINYFQEFKQGFITDSIQIKRIDGSLKAVNINKEIVFEVKEEDL